jgi:hypothetical protein
MNAREEIAGNSYVACIERLKDGSASARDIIEATTQWMEVFSTDTIGERMDEQVSKRTAWLFPNNLLLVVCKFFGPTIVNYVDSIQMDTPAPLPIEIQEEWWVSLPANGWYKSDAADVFPEPDGIFEIIEILTQLHGAPKLVIPWINTWAKDAVGHGEDFWKGDPFRKAVQDMFTIAINGRLGVQSPWEIEFTSERAFLPKDCHFMQFVKLLDEIQKRQIALVGIGVYRGHMSDEGTIEYLRKENPEAANLPIIYVPTGFGDGWFFGNGWVQEALIVVDNADVEKEIYKLVEELQLDFSLPWIPQDVLEGDSWKQDGVLTVTSEWN